MGTMEITASEEGVSLGRFTVDASIQGNLLIRMKLPVKNDLVLPKLARHGRSSRIRRGQAHSANQFAREQDTEPAY